ncbi:MAG: UDP-N-acetylglucosamine 2-epimerase (non-hydrolyzing) [Saprospiraceae bacterium]|nr:UDP-N-acetylglucosamine 2-epimerase (non-hydrolyzing) [Saprospiraceae bacterium]
MKKLYKILTVIGARPHFMKVAALHQAIEQSQYLEHVIVHSGQHYDNSLSGQYIEELNLPTPEYNLQIGSQTPNLQFSDCIKGLDRVLVEVEPDMVLVIGDTNTTAAAAIATKKRNIYLGHIEAGLREFDRSIPEEINKLITDAISDLYFVPTATGVENLRRQNIIDEVYLTGDIGLDLLADQSHYEDVATFRTKHSLSNDYVFMTCHRQVNTSNRDRLKAILEGVSQLERTVIFALHPRTKEAIQTFGLESSMADNIRTKAPLGFWQTQQLIKEAYAVVTDSGGIIKEAYFHKIPSVIIDDQTEWVETLAEGWSILSGAQSDSIRSAIENLRRPETNQNALGDGRAGQRIVQIIEQFLHATRT